MMSSSRYDFLLRAPEAPRASLVSEALHPRLSKFASPVRNPHLLHSDHVPDQIPNDYLCIVLARFAGREIKCILSN